MDKSLELENFVNGLLEEGYTDQEIQEFLEDLSEMSEEEFKSLTEGREVRSGEFDSNTLSRKIYMNPDFANIQGKKKSGLATVNGPYRGSDDQWDSTLPRKKDIKEATESRLTSAKTAWKNTSFANDYGHKDRNKLNHHFDAAGGSLMAGAFGGITGQALSHAGKGFEAFGPVGALIGLGLAGSGLYHAARAAYYKGKMTADHLKDAKKEYNRIRALGESTENIEQEIAIMEAVFEEGNDITSEIITSAITDSAANVQDVFERAIKDRISVLVDQRKADLAGEMFNPVVKESEQIDEISKETLGKYIKKAAYSHGDNMSQSGRYDQIAKDNRDEDDNYEPAADKKSQKHFDKAEKRLKGISRAVDRLKDPYYGESTEEDHRERPLDNDQTKESMKWRRK